MSKKPGEKPLPISSRCLNRMISISGERFGLRKNTGYERLRERPPDGRTAGTRHPRAQRPSAGPGDPTAGGACRIFRQCFPELKTARPIAEWFRAAVPQKIRTENGFKSTPEVAVSSQCAPPAPDRPCATFEPCPEPAARKVNASCHAAAEISMFFSTFIFENYIHR